jgi:UDP-N-acetylmuramate--alanine ligase
LVAEACESDGSLAGYRPAIGLVHNISRDHDEMDGLRRQFQAFAAGSSRLLVDAADEEALALAAEHPSTLSYGRSETADIPVELVRPGPTRAFGVVHLPEGDLDLDLPFPGAHTLDNAVAATVIARELGIEPQLIGAALASWPGIARRFQAVGTTEDGIRIIDDYAHNGAKIAATIEAAQAGCDRLVCIFQPHGFGPARFLRPELRDLLPQLLRPTDRWCYGPIFYAGGTVAQDISSADLAADLSIQRQAAAADSHADVLAWLAETAIPGDTVLIMGARDPRLPALARAALELL